MWGKGVGIWVGKSGRVKDREKGRITFGEKGES